MTTIPPDSVDPPDPEVPAKARRRRFPAQEKLRILREADRCTQHGSIAALLRREGIYASLLAGWRKQRDQRSFAALEDKNRGRKPIAKNPLSGKLKESEREIRRLRRRLKRAELIIDIQKKASLLLGIPLKRLPDEDKE